jgi:hypothetical protein
MDDMSERTMKRLVLCCDGTWNRPDNEHVTNIEKIARSVENSLSRTDGVQQLVLYLSGVGAGSYQVDRLLGGAFGFGLFNNVLSGYRFLAQNYEPGDEIYVFGFSRGAYTARSIVGMVRRVGLVTREALVHGKLREAVDIYRADWSEDATKDKAKAFKELNCHPEVPVRFLGVFDTVGALGVPGAWRRRHQFHNVLLSRSVHCARQALSIDDRRLKFEPALWEVDGDFGADSPLVRQVWFEGVHSDVGGGYKESGLSDTTLLWMATEAHECGLLFNPSYLGWYVESKEAAKRHDSLALGYRVHNMASRVRMLASRNKSANPPFHGNQRNLTRDNVIGVRVAEPVAIQYRNDTYTPDNVRRYEERYDDFLGKVERIRPLPATGSLNDLLERLSRPPE